MNWKWATGLVIACMVVLAFMAAESAKGAPAKPVPPGYRCHPVWLKCWGPGTAPKPPVKLPAPTRTAGSR